MEKEIFEDVLRYLLPHFKVAASFAVKGKKVDIKKIIESNIDFKKLEKEKGKEWMTVLKKQLEILYKTTG